MNERETESGADRSGVTPDASVNSILREPEFWLLHHLPLRSTIPVILFAALAAWVVLALDAPLAAATGVGAGALLLGLAPVRTRNPRNVVGILAEWLAFRWRRVRPGQVAAGAEAFDVPLPEGGSYGMRWDGGLLITMLRIDPPPDALTLLRRGSLSTDQTIPLDEIARCLEQFDINLTSIDVISTGARTAGATPIADLYDRIIGPLPAIAQRTVWLVLRLEPLANAQAVDNRGGSGSGALRTAIIATRRVANRLAARDISVSVLTAGEMNTAARQLLRGIPLDQFTETPKSLVHGDLHLTSYEIGPDLIGERGFSDIWATPSSATTVTVRLRPGTAGTGRGRDTATPSIALDALVRFDTLTEPDGPPLPGLRPLSGRQFRALLDCLPTRIGGSDIGRTGDHRGLRSALMGIAVPTAGCGQLIGADDHGQGIAVPLIGDGTRRLAVVGRLDLAQQVILRSIALGAHVVVHTDRPDAWHTMVSNVDTPQVLSLVSRFSGSGHPAPAATQAGAPIPPTSVVVFDGIAPTALTGGATIVQVRPPEESTDRLDADVILIQDPAAPNIITVRTSAVTTTVNMVTTPEEMRYIGESLTAVR
ncbi:type VII secretion protein EccE [Nocardia sp. NEAU-351]|uniref:Type VII secretion protein EccE n=1 Tax=Nocardia bovistercoris TaxID=2785916 RepID=A0A931ID05_9NOCA|nr:type VII secretion protein EccE [Nocardia bovistercoris]